jgi:drug/metabolite transporter (DMT)-like permease
VTGSIGEVAALATAFFWAGSAVAFEAASKRVGSVPVNLLRLVVAFVLLAAFGLLFHGRALPLEAPPDAWLWLSLSGLVGFTLGDLCLFRSFVLVGARRSLLLMCLAPPMTAILGYLFLGEGLSATKLFGMALTVGGVAWTVLEGHRDPDTRSSEGRHRAWGIVLAVGGALGQAGGLILSKQGMVDFAEPFGAAQIRVLAGALGFAVAFTFAGVWPRVATATKDLRALALLGAGAVCGPFIGVSLSLLAVHNTEAGVASAIMSVTPILMLPVDHFRGQHVSMRAVAGTLLAVGGVVVLFQG